MKAGDIDPRCKIEHCYCASDKALAVGGVTPSEATVKDGSYAIQRPFVLATKTDAKLNDVAQAFFDYVTSPDANAVITAAGVVPAN